MPTNNTTTTDNNNNEQQPQQYDILALPPCLKIALYCLYCFIFILGTIGNMLVIYIIGIKHRVERSCDVHIVSLAVADLLTAVVIPVVMIHDTLTNYMEWHLLGTFGCKLLVSMTHMTSIVSSLMLVTISLTRIRFFLLICFASFVFGSIKNAFFDWPADQDIVGRNKGFLWCLCLWICFIFIIIIIIMHTQATLASTSRS